MSSNILIYGANGYTGELIVELAVSEGAKPILAGRSEDKVRPLAAVHGLDCRIFSLDDPKAVDDGLRDIGVVLHCAGPFSRTAVPMAEGCIRNGVHYLDITGEVDVFESMAVLDDQAKAGGVMLMPGTGFDVVPSDCLAAHLKRRMPEAVSLTLAFQGVGKPSRGTATTMIENIGNGGLIRKDSVITPVPSAWKEEEIDFGEGPVSCMTIPWGDVSTAYYSTGIPNIMVFMAAPAQLRNMAKFSRMFGWVLMSRPVQAFLKRQIHAGPAGPRDSERKKGKSLLWGRVEDASGKAMESRLQTVEGYTLTAMTAWDITKRSVDGEAVAGFQTPSKVLGPDYVLGFEGSSRVDLD